MTNQEAIKLLELYKRLSSHGLLDDLVNALSMAIAALQNPSPGWVRTADRLPTEADAIDGDIVARYVGEGCSVAILQNWRYVVDHSDKYDMWYYVPPLPANSPNENTPIHRTEAGQSTEQEAQT